MSKTAEPFTTLIAHARRRRDAYLRPYVASVNDRLSEADSEPTNADEPPSSPKKAVRPDPPNKIG